MVMRKQQNIKQLVITVIVLLALNFAGNFYFKRFDLTHDKRYTLSDTTLSLVESVEEPLYIDVFLEGDFPGEFKRLQDETKQLLEEFHAYNPNIIFQFVNPLEDESERDQVIQEFYNNGLTPISVTVDDKGKQTQEMVFPWAVASYGDKGAKIQLLKNQMGASTAEKVISSVQHLEYALADALNKVTKDKEKKIAILKGNGEMHDLLMADFLKQVRENYFIGAFTLDSVASNPNKTLAELKKYDLAVIAKPTERFSEEEKEVLDQYIVNGGKTLWMVDAVQIDMDSLYNETGSTLAFPRDLNLNDMFFKYGFRLNPDMIKDELATPIKLATGAEGSGTQYQQYIWRYSPFAYPDPTVYEGANHPVVKNLGGIKLEFANPIDTLENGIDKTILLTSSQYSKPIGTPIEVKLDMVTEQTSPKDYQGFGFIPTSVLLEGQFHSMYENRILPFKDPSYKVTGEEGKMIIISDGDIVKNQLDKNYQPLELGYDKWTKNRYDNKEFLINCVNYLLDDNGLINIRSKDVDLPLLDKERVHQNYTQSQFITVGLPILILLLFGLLFTFLRKRKYSK
ncbi:MAG: gliding motility-associated ABC transporter substrate-binding protein GldG [Flavobacterium sp. MedPE-SWcel]|uniref:gliding motility-associated ABC transporter substrate-binding protein GldG n=1 Tax=uncultured Flavobacterium sp. TaxID=165435 RepID=UPI0009236624|nr:gliding motility-associated ABC transporter substrate-binding protein GldG [uncultured Flavobacterium sp.]OIQ16622.1 MAG: gliding motility-associated ABC transporter substrate-binding protein GldG [Flavobacterium sp. MedPE-SWcel]